VLKVPLNPNQSILNH